MSLGQLLSSHLIIRGHFSTPSEIVGNAIRNSSLTIMHLKMSVLNFNILPRFKLIYHLRYFLCYFLLRFINKYCCFFLYSVSSSIFAKFIDFLQCSYCCIYASPSICALAFRSFGWLRQSKVS